MSDKAQFLIDTLLQFQREHNLTQHEMAERLNVCQTTYNNWINGKSRIAIKYYQVIADVIGVNLNEVIPPEMQVTLSMPNMNTTYTMDALSLHQKLNHHIEARLAFQLEENDRLRKENALLKPQVSKTGSGM